MTEQSKAELIYDCELNENELFILNIAFSGTRFGVFFSFNELLRTLNVARTVFVLNILSFCCCYAFKCVLIALFFIRYHWFAVRLDNTGSCLPNLCIYNNDNSSDLPKIPLKIEFFLKIIFLNFFFKSTFYGSWNAAFALWRYFIFLRKSNDRFSQQCYPIIFKK